jgi:hypothetical protein
VVPVGWFHLLFNGLDGLIFIAKGNKLILYEIKCFKIHPLFYFFWVFNGAEAQKKKDYTEINRGRETPLKSSKATKATSEGG